MKKQIQEKKYLKNYRNIVLSTSPGTFMKVYRTHILAFGRKHLAQTVIALFKGFGFKRTTSSYK